MFWYKIFCPRKSNSIIIAWKSSKPLPGNSNGMKKYVLLYFRYEINLVQNTLKFIFNRRKSTRKKRSFGFCISGCNGTFKALFLPQLLLSMFISFDPDSLSLRLVLRLVKFIIFNCDRVICNRFDTCVEKLRTLGDETLSVRQLRWISTVMR